MPSPAHAGAKGSRRKSQRAVLGDTDITDLVCFTRTDNIASRRVMEKAGFRYERDFERAGLPHALYRMTDVPVTPAEGPRRLME